MTKGTYRAVLVGMKYHHFSAQSGELIASPSIALKRETSNPHDSNAVAVHIRGKIAGHIDRQSAAVIGPILDQGGLCRVADFAWSRDHGSIPLKVLIEREGVSTSRPRLQKAAGIYLITIRGFPEGYIGQARDMDDRVNDHWRDLNLGVHSNPLMRRLWHERGGQAFNAAVVETAPLGLNSLELSQWLETRESHWIEHHDRLTGVLNFDNPKLILVGEDRDRARERRLAERDAAIAVERKRTEISTRMNSIRDQLHSASVEIRRTKENIRKAKGILGFLFATDEQKRQVPKLLARVQRLKIEVQDHEAQLALLNMEMRQLPASPDAVARRLYRHRPARNRSFPT